MLVLGLTEQPRIITLFMLHITGPSFRYTIPSCQVNCGGTGFLSHPDTVPAVRSRPCQDTLAPTEYKSNSDLRYTRGVARLCRLRLRENPHQVDSCRCQLHRATSASGGPGSSLHVRVARFRCVVSWRYKQPNAMGPAAAQLDSRGAVGRAAEACPQQRLAVATAAAALECTR